MTASPAEVGVVGWKCAVCGAAVDIAEALVFRCPNATAADPHHSLRIIQHDARLARVSDDPNPFIAYRPYFAWDSFAAARGMAETDREDMVRATDAKIAAVAGTGFAVTPLERASALSDALGFTTDGGVWIKDETHNVAGSHKARHLFSTLLHLLTVEALGDAPWPALAGRPSLAIASCGNAALAAATLAAAVEWPLQVFVPANADPIVVNALGALGASVTTCPRRRSDPPGDPCVLRCREAVAHGSIPFTVQGPESAWCLDGGRTIGWEMADLHADHLFVQVGGGALARCAIGGLAGAPGRLPKLHAVQTEGCAPLARAWHRALAGEGGVAHASAHWSEYMTPWETPPQSAADGILDDETYDWLGVVSGMAASHGAPIIAKESEILSANALAHEHTTIDASHTGTAGLAGLLAIRDVVSSHERVAVIFSGVRR
ncbi:MAG TPA: pyridoxal-phosphate dependent enzyme [Ilumatobacteraceae bacterium]